MIVIPDAENRTIVSSIRRNVTDRLNEQSARGAIAICSGRHCECEQCRRAVKMITIRSQPLTCSCVRLLLRDVKTTALERLLIYRLCACVPMRLGSREMSVMCFKMS